MNYQTIRIKKAALPAIRAFYINNNKNKTMTNEEKILFADIIISLINDFKKETAPMPKVVGELNKRWGLNGFKLAEVGTPVFEFQGRYLIYLESISGDRSVEVPFFKETLAKNINFHS